MLLRTQRRGSWASDAAHQPLDPPVLQRARGPGRARRRRRARARPHAVQRRADRAAADRASRRWAPVRRRRSEEAARLRAEAARIRAQINPQELEVVANAAREANGIIDQRAFSWTDAVRAVRGDAAAGRADHRRAAAARRQTSFVVAVAVEARRAEDLDAFIEALEARRRVSQRAAGAGTDQPTRA